MDILIRSLFNIVVKTSVTMFILTAALLGATQNVHPYVLS